MWRSARTLNNEAKRRGKGGGLSSELNLEKLRKGRGSDRNTKSYTPSRQYILAQYILTCPRRCQCICPGNPGGTTQNENAQMSYWKRTCISTPISWVRTELLKLSISLLQCLTVNCSYRCIHKRPVTVRKAKCWNSHNWWTKSHTKDILSRMSNCTVLS